jgi:iron complex outermembrane receptor protein
MLARVYLALSCGVSFITLVASPSGAQTEAPAATVAGTGLEEIVVTARRREERVQTVPIAISAFSQADLEAKHIEELRDLYKAVPGFSASVTASDANGLYSGQVRLRGLAGTEIYFAGVPLGTTDYNSATGLTHGLSPGFYFDLDSLEVDKGAQGTLFGRPSIGGLIALEPKRPTTNLEGYIQTTFGNYGDKENEFALNVPVIQEKLLIRVAGQMQQRDGYTKDLEDGKYLDDRNYYSWRAGVTFRPTDDFENYLVYDGYWQDSNGGSLLLIDENPAIKLGSIPLGAGLSLPLTLGIGPGYTGLFNPSTATATAIAGIKAGGFSLVPGSAGALAQQQALGARAIAGRFTSGIGKDYIYGFTDIATWDVTDDFKIKNIAAVRITKQLSSDDDADDGLPILTLGWPGNNHGWNDNSAQYTDELQVSGKALGQKLDWLVGGFLEYDHPVGYNGLPTTAVGNTTYNHFYDSDRSQAVFVHGIYDLSDYVPNLRFTAGYRFTWDYLSIQEHSYSGVDHVSANAAGVPINCGVSPSDRTCGFGTNASFNSPGWNLSLDDQITPDTLVYVRSGNAYRPGGINPAILPPYQSYNPEHVTDVELGIKSDWDLWGIHGRTNADIFHTDYKAIQVSEVVTVINPNTGLPSAQSATLNAATATIEGAEFESTLILPAGFELAGHTTYISSNYGNYPQAFGATGGTPGFQYVPRWQFAITPTYRIPVNESWGKISLALTWSWYGHQSVSPVLAEPIANMPHFQDFDIRADWTDILGSPFDAGFFMTNVTDNLHVVGVVPLMTSLGFSSASYNPPRMYGFSLKYRFGGPGEAAPPPSVYTPPPAQPVTPASIPHSYLVFFDFNRSDLTPEAIQIVDQAAANTSSSHVAQLTVTGHTDTVGSDAYNLRLSRRRAEAVAMQLEKDGIRSSEIEIVAKGKRDPLIPTADGVREPQNRRVQIVYSGQES